MPNNTVQDIPISWHLMRGNTAAEYGCIFQGDIGVQIVIIQPESSEITADTQMVHSLEGRGK